MSDRERPARDAVPQVAEPVPGRTMVPSFVLALLTAAATAGMLVQRVNHTCSIDTGVNLLFLSVGLAAVTWVTTIVQRIRLGSGRGRRGRLVLLYLVEAAFAPALLVGFISLIFADSC